MAINQIIDRVVGTATTTDGTTWVTILSYIPIINSVTRGNYVLTGKDSSINGASTGGIFATTRVAGDTTLLNQGGESSFLSAALITVQFRVQVTGTIIEIQAKGVAATTIEWFCELTIRIA